MDHFTYRDGALHAEDVPMAPVVFAKGVMANNPRVHNYFPTGYSFTWPYQWVWIEK